LGFEGRRANLDPVIAETFDIPPWRAFRQAHPGARCPMPSMPTSSKPLTIGTVATYAGNFSEYDGETFVTKSQSADDGKGNVLVNTRLDVKGIPPVLFNYRLHKATAFWKIFDIYLDGAISQLAMHRAEFAACSRAAMLPDWSHT